MRWQLAALSPLGNLADPVTELNVRFLRLRLQTGRSAHGHERPFRFAPDPVIEAGFTVA
jgi:hypothetical protein